VALRLTDVALPTVEVRRRESGSTVGMSFCNGMGDGTTIRAGMVLVGGVSRAGVGGNAGGLGRADEDVGAAPGIRSPVDASLVAEVRFSTPLDDFGNSGGLRGGLPGGSEDIIVDFPHGDHTLHKRKTYADFLRKRWLVTECEAIHSK
jgi:hypothetical protein